MRLQTSSANGRIYFTLVGIRNGKPFRRDDAAIHYGQRDLCRWNLQPVEDFDQQGRFCQLNRQPRPFLRVVPAQMAAEMQAHIYRLCQGE